MEILASNMFFARGLSRDRMGPEDKTIVGRTGPDFRHPRVAQCGGEVLRKLRGLRHR